MSKKQKFTKFAKIVIEHVKSTDLINSSVLISYYVLLAIFPVTIVVGNLLPLLGVDPIITLEYIDILIPEAVSPILAPVVESLFTQSSGGLLSISIVVALWSASRGINRMQYGFNKAYGIESKRGAFFKRLLSMLTLLLLLFTIIAFIIVMNFGLNILDFFSRVVPVLEEVALYLRELRFPVTFLFVFIALLIIYIIAPDTKVKLSHAAPGAAFSTVGLIALAQAFAIYMRFITNSLSSYGALSTFFVLMFWLNFSAIILLLGAVLNASISEYRFGKAVLGKPVPVPKNNGEPPSFLGAAVNVMLNRQGEMDGLKEYIMNSAIEQQKNNGNNEGKENSTEKAEESPAQEQDSENEEK